MQTTVRDRIHQVREEPIHVSANKEITIEIEMVKISNVKCVENIKKLRKYIDNLEQENRWIQEQRSIKQTNFCPPPPPEHDYQTMINRRSK